MTQTVFRSTHQAVLAMWEFHVDEHEQWTQRMLAEQERLRRSIYRIVSGLKRREVVVGIEYDPNRDNPWGWVKLQQYGFLVPARGPAGDPARQLLAELQPPPSAQVRLASFGVASHFIGEDRVFWPGLDLLDDGLYITWGCDTGWTGGDWFEPVSVEEYQAALQRQ